MKTPALKVVPALLSAPEVLERLGRFSSTLILSMVRLYESLTGKVMDVLSTPEESLVKTLMGEIDMVLLVASLFKPTLFYRGLVREPDLEDIVAKRTCFSSTPIYGASWTLSPNRSRSAFERASMVASSTHSTISSPWPPTTIRP
jgi:hypothetical protein